MFYFETGAPTGFVLESLVVNNTRDSTGWDNALRLFKTA